jgi:N-acetylglucosaminyldiphosphoundecaprenol N-acetyl-beta-D-mannosaminyltransferase
MFFLGAKPGISEIAAENLCKKYHTLKIFSHHGHFDHFGEKKIQVVEKIRESNAQLLLVGMGMPLQERWIKENFDALPNVNIFFPVGALFDYIAKTTPRGPHWLTDYGFEWLTRLIIEPKRLWRRYILGIPLFFIRIFKQRF